MKLNFGQILTTYQLNRHPGPPVVDIFYINKRGTMAALEMVKGLSCPGDQVYECSTVLLNCHLGQNEDNGGKERI